MRIGFVYGYAACNITYHGLPDSGYRSLALVLSGHRLCRSGLGIPSVHEEVLLLARGVFGVVESKKIIFLNLGRYLFELCLSYAPFVPTYKRYPDSAVCTAVA